MRFNTLFGYFILITFSPLIGKLIKNIILLYKQYKKFKTPNSLVQLIYRLTPYEFEIWSGEYLTKLGFTNVTVLPLEMDGEKDIICYKNNEKYYVKCKRYSLTNSVTLYQAEKLLGAMIADDVDNGIIITTGHISKDAKAFLSSLKKPYNIDIISADDLTLTYSQYILETKTS
ncbi:restriction endonuclease [Clostridium celatum]|uniref:Restriction endonuclease n=1 Tax=Clostridium celatum DSM 1785 TaxID=545697 RepID=L1QF17_9CLOT|nr:restriction endonuclease [Clostridium celatum]EKY26265.1 restriction endonuclease [Clostridium celatum DSM 1785]MCE9654007.1 restriction endonuclease [Clostridium celatum]MDU2265003.1 restriction endonuclease [Clostridium celatum]MDU6294319.1 restriction endonuclease [Clostridium celatum]